MSTFAIITLILILLSVPMFVLTEIWKNDIISTKVFIIIIFSVTIIYTIFFVYKDLKI